VTLQVSAADGKMDCWMKMRVLYSSTCPASAGLSQQLLGERFAQVFAESPVTAERVQAWLGQTAVAFPHAQRSEATVELRVDEMDVLGANALGVKMLALIDLVENALGTPVQAAVKREDEQEFARRNAENLMFCEDAARKLKVALSSVSSLQDFKIEVRHFESLHAHDVVARVGKFS
jgi:GTP cyclohydrolase I